MSAASADRAFLTRFAWLSIGAAVLTIGLKTVAYLLTDSVGMLSDALESSVNLVGAVIALIMLTIAARPADDDHTYGHSKAEYFSSGVEGTLILIAAASIAYAAVRRLLNPQPLEQVGIGLAVSLVASLINLVTAIIIMRAARTYNSITLEANGRHLLTDVWTSVGVIAGVAAVALTGWVVLDPLIALVVAANIVWSGVGIVRSSVDGLMDTALPAADLQTISEVLALYGDDGIEFHAIRTRQSGARGFASMHVLVPGEWTVQAGHELLEHIEADLAEALPNVAVTTHLEALDDPASYADQSLDRLGGPGA